MTSIPTDPNMLTSDNLSDIDVTDQLSEFNIDEDDNDNNIMNDQLIHNINNTQQDLSIANTISKGQQAMSSSADLIINRAIQRFKQYITDNQSTYMAVIISLIVMAILILFTFIFSLCNVMALIKR